MVDRSCLPTPLMTRVPRILFYATRPRDVLYALGRGEAPSAGTEGTDEPVELLGVVDEGPLEDVGALRRSTRKCCQLSHRI